jgi:hypothetical protein
MTFKSRLYVLLLLLLLLLLLFDTITESRKNIPSVPWAPEFETHCSNIL